MWSTGSTLPVGLLGEFSHSSDTRAGPMAVNESATSTSDPGQPGAHVVRRVGQLGDHDPVLGTEPQEGGQPGHELLGADRGSTSVPDGAPSRRDTHAVIASRVAGAPVVRGYPGESAAAARASAMTGGVGSTGVPMDRSTIPPG